MRININRFKLEVKMISILIALILNMIFLVNYSFTCVPPDPNPPSCTNNDPRCPTCCNDAGGGGECGFGPIGGNEKYDMALGVSSSVECSGQINSSGINNLMMTKNLGSVISGYEGGLAATKRFLTFQLSFFNIQTNGKFKLSPTICYSSFIAFYYKNTNGETTFGPGWLLDFDMYLQPIEGTNNFLLRTPTGLPHILYKDQNYDIWYADLYKGIAGKLTKGNDPNYGGTIYILTLDDNLTQYVFNNNGKLVYMKDNNGNKLSFTYNSYNNLQRIDADSFLNGSDIDSRYITFYYNPQNTRVIKITSSDEREILFTYDSINRLTDIYYKKNATGTQYQLYHFVYIDQYAGYQIAEVHRPRGDGSFGKVFSYEYNNTDVYRIKDADGNILIETMYPYNEPGVAVITKGNLTTKYFYGYTRIPYRVEKIYTTGNPPQYVTFIQQQPLRNNQYGEIFFPQKTIDDAGNETIYEYQLQDGSGDPRNSRISKITYPDGSYEQYSYELDGKIATHTDRKGNTTWYYYDNPGRNLSRIKNALNQNTYYDYDSLGRLISITDAEGKTTTYTYYNTGLVHTITTPENKTTTYNYNSWGLVTSIIDSNNKTTTYNYNDLGIVTSIIDPAGNTTSYGYNASFFKTSVTDPKGNITQYQYDQKGNMISVTDARNNTTYFSYNVYSNLIRVTDARGKQTNYEYDPLKRLIKETDPLNKSITYEYYEGGGCSSCGAGGMGQLKKKTDAKGQITEYEYDNMNRLKKIKYPNNQYVEFTYDANGNRLTMYDTRLATYFTNPTFSYQYDALNRVTRETYPNGDYIEYAYNSAGQRISMRYPNGDTQAYSYNNTTKRLTSLTHPKIGSVYYNYNSEGLLSQITYPNYLTNNFIYDNLYHIDKIDVRSTIGEENQYYGIDYSYDANGNRIQAIWTSDIQSSFNFTKTYTYDAINQMLSETKENMQYQTVYSYTYVFDAVGNRTQMIYEQQGQSDVTTNYAYNNGNQLTWRSISNQEEGYSYIYDNNGNMVKEDKDDGLAEDRIFTWNQDDRLIGFQKGSQSVSYVYDAMGRRIMRINQDTGEQRMYYYDGLSVVAEKKKPNGGSWAWDKIYVIAPGVISHIIAESQNTGTQTNPVWTNKFYHYDAIGNVVAHTASDGSLLALFDQEAYGNVKTIIGSGSQSGYHLTTKESDPTSELYYFYQRWYDSNIGRFISKDFIKKFNFYFFVSNNPIGRIDNTGLLVLVPMPLGPGFPYPGGDWPKEPVNIPNPVDCVKNILEEVDNNYDGTPPHDKYKHCLVACRVVKECAGDYFSDLLILLGLYGYEILGGWDGGLSGDSMQDIIAGIDGMGVGHSNNCCEKGCADAGYIPSKK